MPNPEKPEDYLIDTSIFIHWFRGDKKARDFFHSAPRKIHYSKITISDALIAATAITRRLILVTTNTRHFYPIKKLMVQDLLTTNAPL